MILVTGGCFQGKTDYACETFHIAKEEAADGMDCPMEAIYKTSFSIIFMSISNGVWKRIRNWILRSWKDGIRTLCW